MSAVDLKSLEKRFQEMEGTVGLAVGSNKREEITHLRSLSSPEIVRI
jgi:hypothetical protein